MLKTMVMVLVSVCPIRLTRWLRLFCGRALSRRSAELDGLS